MNNIFLNIITIFYFTLFHENKIVKNSLYDKYNLLLFIIHVYFFFFSKHR